MHKPVGRSIIPGKMGDFGRGRFPVLPVKRLDPEVLRGHTGEAAGIDAVAVRVGSGHIEGLDPAMAAEKVLCHARIEGIAGQGALALEEPETAVGDDQVQKTQLPTARAIAGKDLEGFRRIHLESDGPAMATPKVGLHTQNGTGSFSALPAVPM